MGSGFLGMRGTGEWSTGEQPLSWREGTLKFWPNGGMPLTAIQSKGKKKKVTDPTFKWFTKDLAVQGGASVAYEDALLSTAFGAGDAGIVGTAVYAKVAAATVSHFRKGHIVLMVETADSSVYAFGRVQSTHTNGASSYVLVTLREACIATVLSTVDYIDIIGDANPEGGDIPDSIAYDPDLYENKTQIFRTSLDITRTARETHLRSEPAYNEAKREALLYHGVGIELATMFNPIATEFTGENGKKERTTQGVGGFIHTNAPANELTWSGTWLTGGEAWIDEALEVAFRKASNGILMGTCGSLALLGLQKLVKNLGTFEFKATTAEYGIEIVKWKTVFGTLILKVHPLMTHRAYRRREIYIFDPTRIETKLITDTMFKGDDVKLGLDGTKQEFLSEFGYAYGDPEEMMILRNVGGS